MPMENNHNLPWTMVFFHDKLWCFSWVHLLKKLSAFWAYFQVDLLLKATTAIPTCYDINLISKWHIVSTGKRELYEQILSTGNKRIFRGKSQACFRSSWCKKHGRQSYKTRQKIRNIRKAFVAINQSIQRTHLFKKGSSYQIDHLLSISTKKEYRCKRYYGRTWYQHGKPWYFSRMFLN